MQEILQEVAEEEVSLSFYPTYIEESIEEEESPVDDFREWRNDKTGLEDTVDDEDLGQWVF